MYSDIGGYLIFFCLFTLNVGICQPKEDIPDRFSISVSHLSLFSKVNFGDQLFFPFLSRPYIVGYEEINRPVFYSGWRSSIAYRMNPRWEMTLNVGMSTFGVQSRMYYYENRQVSPVFGGEKIKFINSFFDFSISGKYYIWGKSSTASDFLRSIYSGITLNLLISERSRAENHILQRNNSVISPGGQYFRWRVINVENVFQSLQAATALKGHRLGGSLLIGIDIPIMKSVSLIHEVGFTYSASLLYPNGPGTLLLKDGSIAAVYLMNGVRIFIF